MQSRQVFICQGTVPEVQNWNPIKCSSGATFFSAGEQILTPRCSKLMRWKFRNADATQVRQGIEV